MVDTQQAADRQGPPAADREPPVRDILSREAGPGPVVRRTRHQDAAAAIGRRILSGEWPGGQALPTEADLSRELQVSRASLREAIKLLSGKGLIRSTPRRGTIVQPRSTWNRLDVDVLDWQSAEGTTTGFVKDLFELRRMIEPDVAALAASRADDGRRAAIQAAFQAMEAAPDTVSSIQADLSFHRAIVLGTGNELLAVFTPPIEASLAVSFKVSRANMMTQDHVVPMHRAVAEAILRGDPGEARAAMLALLDRSEVDALRAVEQEQGPP